MHMQWLVYIPVDADRGVSPWRARNSRDEREGKLEEKIVTPLGQVFYVCLTVENTGRTVYCDVFMYISDIRRE
jgi:hypothetical protein